MLLKFFLSLFILAALPGGSSGEIVRPNYYDDFQDSANRWDGHELTHDGFRTLSCAEVYGVNDTYDYVTYYAPYTRSVFLNVVPTDNCIAYVDAFVPSFSEITPYVSYRSDTVSFEPNQTVFVEQGSAVIYRIRCSGNCWWEAHLYTDPHFSPYTYVSYDKFYGYDMPYYGIPDIKFAYDDSVYELVPGQNYTWYDVMEEAIAIWESCGNIDFRETYGSPYFTCSVDSTVLDISVVHTRHLLSNNYYTSSLKLTTDMTIYNSVIHGQYNKNGSPATIKQAILGHAVIAFGLAAGVGLNGTSANTSSMMRIPFWWYDRLSDGDIGSLLALWGDANGQYV